MKNYIKKIVVSTNDDNTIKGILVIRENSVEKYGYKEETNKPLEDIYSESVVELINQNKEKYDGLKNQQIVNILNDEGKILVNENYMMKITEYVEPIKFVVSYENQDVEVKEEGLDTDKYNEEYRNYLEDLCDTYNIPFDNIEEAINTLTTLGLYEKKVPKKELVTVLKENKVKNFIANHSVISKLVGAGLLLALVAVGAKSCSKQKENDNTKNIISFESQATPAPTSTPYEEVLEKDEFVFIEETTPEPTIVPKEISFDNEDSYFSDLVKPSSDVVVMKDLAGREYGNDYISVESLIEIRNQNIDSIENRIQSNIEIEDAGMYIYFENLFNDFDLTEKAYVKYFSMMGNEIINRGYDNNIYRADRGVQFYSKLSCTEVVRLIRNNQPLKMNIYGQEQYVYFSNLSREAKEVILYIVWSNYTCLNRNSDEYFEEDQYKLHENATVPEIEYGQEVFSKADIADIITRAYDKLSYSK